MQTSDQMSLLVWLNNVFNLCRPKCEEKKNNPKPYFRLELTLKNLQDDGTESDKMPTCYWV